MVDGPYWGCIVQKDQVNIDQGPSLWLLRSSYEGTWQLSNYCGQGVRDGAISLVSETSKIVWLLGSLRKKRRFRTYPTSHLGLANILGIFSILTAKVFWEVLKLDVKNHIDICNKDSSKLENYDTCNRLRSENITGTIIKLTSWWCCLGISITCCAFHNHGPVFNNYISTVFDLWNKVGMQRPSLNNSALIVALWCQMTSSTHRD